MQEESDIECRLSAGSVISGQERRKLLEELVTHYAPQTEQEADLPDLTGREIS